MHTKLVEETPHPLNSPTARPEFRKPAMKPQMCSIQRSDPPAASGEAHNASSQIAGPSLSQDYIFQAKRQ